MRAPRAGYAQKWTGHPEVLREMVRAGAGAEPTAYRFTAPTGGLQRRHKAQRVSTL